MLTSFIMTCAGHDGLPLQRKSLSAAYRAAQSSSHPAEDFQILDFVLSPNITSKRNLPSSPQCLCLSRLLSSLMGKDASVEVSVSLDVEMDADQAVVKVPRALIFL